MWRETLTDPLIIKVTKVEAAQRQVDAAIRLLFDKGDPIAVHTLACAGYRIFRDLCEARGTPGHKATMAHIRLGKEKEFWAAMNRAANFLKHADQDPDAVLDGVDERANDFVLWLAISAYADLDSLLTAEMQGFCFWFRATNRDLFDPEVSSLTSSLLGDMGVRDWMSLPREEQLEVGRIMVEACRILARVATSTR